MSISYDVFVSQKQSMFEGSGFISDISNSQLYDFQMHIVKWALKKGRAAIFADCGLGKTPMQLIWANEVAQYTNKTVLIVTPLAVSTQTVKEAKKFNVIAKYHRTMPNDGDIWITNYEMLKNFSMNEIGGIVLDESSILKSFMGKFRNMIIETCQNVPYKLACTATPAPNDYMELGNHAEFLNVMKRTEMLSKFFYHDGGKTSQWNIKGHAISDFWDWVASWSIAIEKPSNLGFNDDDFILPSLNIKHEYVEIDEEYPEKMGTLFAMPVSTLIDQRRARKSTMSQRIHKVVEIVNNNPGPCVIWCELNDESKNVTDAISGAVEIKGSDPIDYKSEMLHGFTEGNFDVLVSKPSIAGFGMNWQHCNTIIFMGVSHSYEMFYQTIRRCWRFGQKNPVNVYVIMSRLDDEILFNLERKEKDANDMKHHMTKSITDAIKKENRDVNLKQDMQSSDDWEMIMGDCVKTLSNFNDNSFHYSIFSPPFAQLYTYSDSPYDMGNCKDLDEFFSHYRYLINELLRVIMPGRLLSLHCMNLPSQKARDGVIGLIDFRGEIIRAFVDAGWIYHSEVCIWKDPVTAMQRTKALGLLHKQIKKDASMSRMGIPDYVVTFRKPGENPEPVKHTNDDMPVSLWQRYASPIWMDINASDTLQYRSAREEKDEKHICPLQLEVIRRCIDLWTNPNDIVMSPFAGIGSEGYVAIEKGRRFLGIELKESYYRQACANMHNAVMKFKNQGDLFGEVENEKSTAQIKAVS